MGHTDCVRALIASPEINVNHANVSNNINTRPFLLVFEGGGDVLIILDIITPNILMINIFHPYVS